MDAMKIANGLPMWIACGIPVCMVLIQAITFFKKAYAAGEKVDLTKGQMKEAIRSAAITSIGPSIVVLSGMLSLLITVGGFFGAYTFSVKGCLDALVFDWFGYV